jgi:hypothetical protein
MDCHDEGLGSKPGHEKWRPRHRGPTIQQHYQGAEHHKPEKRKPEESLAPINVESKVAGSIPPQDDGVFQAIFLRNLVIMMYLYMCLFSLG